MLLKRWRLFAPEIACDNLNGVMEKEMTDRTYLFTSESVSEGHPDKIADQISDAVLDAFLREDQKAKVACETLVADNHITVCGEFRCSNEEVFRSVEAATDGIVRKVLKDIGYRDAGTGIDPDRCDVKVRFNKQSDHIHQGVERNDGAIGAGDQGLMFGFACDETPDLIPYSLWLSHRLVQRQAKLRKSGELPWLRPDAKSQVTVEYLGTEVVGVKTVVLSTQHSADVDNDTIQQTLLARIIDPLIPTKRRLEGFRVLINPTGRFEIGGPKGDTGLTGRKIIVDTYGGACPHGGGAFSGKDPTKVDRSAAYMARYVAKNIVAAGLARRCTVQLAYAIGIAEPVSLMIDTHGTGLRSDADLEYAVEQVFDLTPLSIIETLGLQAPIYRPTASYGHFGRENFSWERTDKIEALTASLPITAVYGK